MSSDTFINLLVTVTVGLDTISTIHPLIWYFIQSLKPIFMCPVHLHTTRCWCVFCVQFTDGTIFPSRTPWSWQHQPVTCCCAKAGTRRRPEATARAPETSGSSWAGIQMRSRRRDRGLSGRSVAAALREPCMKLCRWSRPCKTWPHVTSGLLLFCHGCNVVCYF